MHRTQLMLENWQYVALKARAEQSDRSLSEVVRRILTEHLSPTTPPDPDRDDPLLAFDSLFSDAGLSGTDHDRALYGLETGQRR